MSKIPHKGQRPGSAKATETASASLMTDSQAEKAPRLGNAFSVTVKNLSDDKLYSVKVFDIDFENNRKIQYTFGGIVLTYKEFLHAIPDFENAFKIGRIQTHAGGDYAKFWSKQLISPYHITSAGVNGNFASLGILPVISPYQQQTNTVVNEISWSLYRGVNVNLPFLMPEVSITFTFFQILAEQKK